MSDFFTTFSSTTLDEAQKRALFNECIGQGLAKYAANVGDIVPLVRVKGGKIQFFFADTEGRWKNADEAQLPAIVADLLEGIEDDEWDEASQVPAGVNAKAAMPILREFAMETLKTVTTVNFRTADVTVDNKKIFCVFAKTAAGKTKKATI